MPKRAPGRIMRWQATAILTLFFFAVAGAAAIGWWYARELPAYQGPFVLISVDGPQSDAPPSKNHDVSELEATPALDALAADAVVFDRAYTHSPLTLPAHASLLSGRLPFEHGVRDDAGYTLDPGVRTLAQLLRNRGFRTGGAVSSFLLRGSTGIAQGFSAYAERTDEPIAPGLYLQPVSTHPPYLLRDETSDPLEAELASASERAGMTAIDEAERWARAQANQRYFLFLAVGHDQADEAVARLAQLLRDRQLYDHATIILVGARGTAGVGEALDEQALRVPLLVKQPRGEGAGRHVAVPVQHIDLVPTILDLVRAPIPRELKGQSLRGLLTDERARVDSHPIYSESLAGYLRFGGQPLFALTLNDARYVRGITERIERVDDVHGTSDTASSTPADSDLAVRQTNPAVSLEELKPLRATLDRFLAGHTLSSPVRIPEADRERIALAAGYLPGLRPVPGVADVHLADTAAQQPLARAHHRAARLVGQRRLPAAIYVLQRMLREQPDAATVHYQIGLLSSDLGRRQEAIAALETAAMLRSESPEAPMALAATFLAAGRADEAQASAELAVTLSKSLGSDTVSAAHQMAARVALARKDRDLALKHADEAQAANPAVPMRSFVEGHLFIESGQYEAAARLLQDAASRLKQHDTALEGVYAGLATALAASNRVADAETACLEELRAFPRNLAAYATLARVAYAARNDGKVESVIEQLLAAAPTQDGYATAMRLWKEFGASSRAEALRSDARARFRVDPLLARLPARDGRR